MSSFLFSRSTPPANEKVAAPVTKEDLASLSTAIAEAQAITSSAIFALLVSKGILSAKEASEYMVGIGDALSRDVEPPVGVAVANVLRSYAAALNQADK